jgi:hypothetical protein
MDDTLMKRMVDIAVCQICIRILQNRVLLLKKIANGTAATSRSEKRSRWERALTAFDASFAKKRMRGSGGSIQIPSGGSSSPRPSLLDLEASLLFEFLDVPSLYKTAGACRRLLASCSPEGLWSSRPLDLGHVSSYKAWEDALRRCSRSKHWVHATIVTAPRAKSIMIASEVLSFFGRRLCHLDLSRVDYLSLVDYMFMIPARSEASLLDIGSVSLPNEEGRGTVGIIGRILARVMSEYGI